MVGKVAFPGWDGKFLVSGVEEGNQWQGNPWHPPYKYHPDVDEKSIGATWMRNEASKKKEKERPEIGVRPDHPRG